MSFEKVTIRDCTLYRGDCLEVLPTLGKVDAVVTDPPYGVTQNEWDKTEAVYTVFDWAECPLVCTAQNPFTSELVCRYRKRFKWSDVWEKTQATGFLNVKVMPMRRHEDILVFCTGRMPYTPQITDRPPENIRPHLDTAGSSNYGSFSNERTRTIPLNKTYPQSIAKFANSQDGDHPTQKPVSLFTYLVASYSLEGQSILDPFMGSGTTGVACVKLGRKFIGVEIEPKYFDIACKRIERAYEDAALLDLMPVEPIEEQSELFAEVA